MRAPARLRAAWRTNSIQCQSVIILTVMMLLACHQRADTPGWLWLVAMLFWPTVAFLANLVDPIPAQAEDDGV